MTLTVSIEEVLLGLPFFRRLPEVCLARMAGVCRIVELGAGDILFHDGDTARGAWFVVFGKVAVFKLGPDGKEQILRVWERGDMFGEVGLFGSERYPVSAQAMTDSQVVLLPRVELIDELREYPELALALLGAMSERQRHLVALVESLSLKEVPMRLAAYLVGAAPPGTNTVVDLDFSKAKLAALLGTIPETLSRTLARMDKAGLVVREGAGQIRILDREGLAGVAQGIRKV